MTRDATPAYIDKSLIKIFNQIHNKIMFFMIIYPLLINFKAPKY